MADEERELPAFVIKALEEAGAYNETLSKEEMLNCFKAITNSKADEEDQWQGGGEMEDVIENTLNQLQNEKREVKPKPLRRAVKSKLTLMPEEKTKKSPLNIESITYQDMRDDLPKSTLNIIHHKPQYKIAILHENIPLAEKAAKLADYHTRIIEVRAVQARKSLTFAPHPKPIHVSASCTTSLRKNYKINGGGDDEETIENDGDGLFMDVDKEDEDLYTSRSGRQVLKRSYTEPDSDSENSLPTFPNKRMKNINISDSLKISNLEDVIESEEESKELPSSKKPKQTKKQIRPLAIEKKTRAELMIEKATAVHQEKQKQEMEQKEFEETLTVHEDENSNQSDGNSSSPILQPISEQSENEQVRRRVPPPPISKRQPIKKKAAGTDSKEIPWLEKTAPKGQKRNTKSKVVRQKCPICSKTFPEHEIMDHAANCGDLEVEVPCRTRSKITTCEHCDKVLDEGEYVSHSKKCMQS